MPSDIITIYTLLFPRRSPRHRQQKPATARNPINSGCVIYGLNSSSVIPLGVFACLLVSLISTNWAFAARILRTIELNFVVHKRGQREEYTHNCIN